MEMKEILSDIQRSIDDLQQKLNLLRGVQTGTLYDVDVLMTRKEAAFFLGKSHRQLDRLCGEGQIVSVSESRPRTIARITPSQQSQTFNNRTP